MKTFLLFIISIFIFSGCSQKFTKIDNLSEANLKEISWDEIDGFDSDNIDESFEVFKLACSKKSRFEYLQIACENTQNYSDGRSFFKDNFTPFKLFSDDGKKEGLITGYYEPILNGSFEKTSVYKYPVYSLPEDLIVVDLSSVYPELKDYRLRGRLVGNKVIPYETRKNIDKNENVKPLLYVDSKIDKFFLEIQGSGKIRLPNGEIVNVGYANQNGHKYYSIGKKLIEIDAIKREDISLQSIKKWLEENPNKQDEILNLNESIVFFTQSDKSATGALGVPLVAKRNIAVDRNYIPLGLPVFINTTNPLNEESIDRLMVAADVGGAIKGEIRADFFWGNSNEAEELAGKMKQKGELILFVPNKYIK